MSFHSTPPPPGQFLAQGVLGINIFFSYAYAGLVEVGAAVVVVGLIVVVAVFVVRGGTLVTGFIQLE